ncbi:phospholipase D-like domain-containing protein [Helicobacter ailurogastricus]|uniref:phospholipase D-like domain-containing protein n=1 Tax=Helicobacter ailurogastricus TaxID=1578720 RepID=UPI00244D933E|nr:phospholipase D-like domain-containing protein [Helicobacter ailurogastricus]GMB91145.1 Nuclease NucT [Helicobacter ailurogastricus]
MRCLKAFLFPCLLSIALQATPTLYMLPYEQHEALKSLISGINASKSQINISIYSFTHKDIAKALKDAAARGVKINIIYDASGAHGKYSTMGYLAKYRGISTCTLSGKEVSYFAKGKEHKGIMHQKLAIIDHNTIFLGSANWSKNAFENNYELLLKDNDPALIQKAQSYYKKMWSACH